jgi:hypothetical protein
VLVVVPPEPVVVPPVLVVVPPEPVVTPPLATVPPVALTPPEPLPPVPWLLVVDEPQPSRQAIETAMMEHAET